MTAPATAVKLNAANLSSIDATRARLPDYARDAVATGILHLGPGAFHRAHQADYFDRLLADDPRWGIAGVSLRSAAIAEALATQDGLYTLAILDEEIRYRVIGSVQSVVRAVDVRCRDLQIAPSIKLITLTITEKGYCLNGDGSLDFNHADVAADLHAPHAPVSAIGWLVETLRLRFEAGLSAPDILSCDNLPGNGEKLRGAVIAFAATRDNDLAKRIAEEARFPNSMVDSITPATDDALRARVASEAGIDDCWPIQREAFTSWVIEDRVCANFPDLTSVGAVMTADVASHEQAKLRMLNGAHSTLAYLGLGRGHKTVAEAMCDPDLSAFLDQMMQQEIAPSFAAPRGLNLDDYRWALLARFRNPSISHKLSQIAWDGSQKLPIRLLATIADNLQGGRPVARLCAGVAAWMRFICCNARAGAAITDPSSRELAEIGLACRGEARHDCALFFEKTRIFPDSLLHDARFVAAVHSAYDHLSEGSSSMQLEKAVGQ